MYLRGPAAPRLPIQIPLALIASLACACSSRRTEPNSRFLVVGAPRSSYRLLSGFYGAEQNRWRWTGRTFAVSLSGGEDLAEESRRLVLHFAIPHEAARQLLPLEISAAIDGLELRPELFRNDGRQAFTRVIPGDVLARKEVAVSFSLNRWIPPTPSDRRELGIIVESIGFE